ncbi:MAG: hypothetical protein J6R59_02660 [Paludibacteraceae bacterium]|nr:hypothetical protein [Paludibacteraceae bacterium]
MSDEFGLVGIAVNGQIIGDTSGENGNINSDIFTVSISAKDLITDNSDFNNTTSYTIQGGAEVSSSKIEGANYPNNGKVGIAPRIVMSGNNISFGDNTSKITLTCKSEDLVGCATFNTKDRTIKI